MKTNFHKILFFTTIAFFTIILIQTIWHPINFKPLKGVTVKTELPKFTFESYSSNKFQSQFEKYTKENFGFREWTFRMYNQYIWSCYHKTNAFIVVEGKEGYLYEKEFVRDHYESLMYNHTNDTSVMKDLFETEALRLWKVQELLKEHDIHIFVNLIPGKDIIYPEYLPENIYTRPDGIHAYDYYKPKFDELGINYIDNVTYFQEIKDKVEELNIDKYILDLRGNAGGNSEILNPFQDLVRDKKLNGVLLIDSGVFSSGRFAIAKFKKEFNTLLIGTPTGGAASSYGYNNNDSVEDKSFSYSIRYWDFSEIFKSKGAIVPDIIVENTIEDLENNYDRVLKKAFEILKVN